MRAAAWLTGLLMLAAPAFPQAKPAPRPIKFRLIESPFKKGYLRPGYRLQGAAPESGWRARVGRDTLFFVDLDGNGLLEAEKDGFGLNAHRFIVQLPGVLLLKTGQFRVAFEETKVLLLTPVDLGAAQKLVKEAALVTDLRVGAGVRPAALDPAACLACEKHCDYLKANGLNNVSAGMRLHQEQAGRPGYTREGAAAAKRSSLDVGSALTGFGTTLLRWHAMAWHSDIVDPRVTRFGGTFRHGVAMFYASGRGGKMDRIFLHPADGEAGVPLSFASGEMPNPVPGTDNGAGCGFPIRIRLVRPYRNLVSAKVTDASGRPVAGTISSPAKPANPQWRSNSGCALFIPSRPLRPNMLYRVEFKFAEANDPVVWSFTTGR